MGKDIATEHKVDIDQFMMQTPVAHSLATKTHTYHVDVTAYDTTRTHNLLIFNFHITSVADNTIKSC